MPNIFLFLAVIASLLAGCGQPREGRGKPASKETTLPSGMNAGNSLTPKPEGSIGNWSRLYGDNGDCRAVEDGLQLNENSVPQIVWSRDVGTGYSAPAIRDGFLVQLHRRDDAEVVTCLTAATGEDLWEQEYPTAFECDYPAYSSGPYSTPLVTDRGRIRAECRRNASRILSR